MEPSTTAAAKTILNGLISRGSKSNRKSALDTTANGVIPAQTVLIRVDGYSKALATYVNSPIRCL